MSTAASTKARSRNARAAMAAGIRAKLHGPDKPFADFLIERDPVNPLVIQAAGIDIIRVIDTTFR